MRSHSELWRALRSYLLPAGILLGILFSNFFTEIGLFSHWFKVGELEVTVLAPENQAAEKFDLGGDAEDDKSFDTTELDPIALKAMQESRFADAARIFSLATKTNSQDAASWNGLGVAQVRMGNTAEADKSFLEALRIDPLMIRARFNWALLRSQQGDTASAIQGYREVLRLQTGNVEARYNLAVQLMRRGELDTAKSLLHQVVETNRSQRFAGAWYNLGLIAHRQDSLTMACAFFQKTIKLKPDHVNAWLAWANALGKREQDDSATLLYKQVLRLDSRQVKAYYQLAMQTQKRGQADSAGVFLQKCVEIDPSYSKAYLTMAQVELRKGKPRDALRQAQEMLLKDPKSTVARSIMAQAYAAMGQWDKSVQNIEDALRIDPNYVEGLQTLGILYLKNEKAAEGEECFLRALEKRPDFWEARYNLGLSYLKGGKSIEAETEFRRVLQDRPRHIGAIFNLGAVGLQKRDLTMAQEMFRKALALDSTHAQSWFSMGRMYGLQGKEREAEASYQKALQIREIYPEAHFNLARLKAKSGEETSAIAEYQKAIAQDPQYAEAYLNMGVLQFKSGAEDLALASYRKALQLRPQYAQAWFNLAMAYNRLNQAPKAIEAYQKAISAQGDYGDAAYNLSILFMKLDRYPEAEVVLRKLLEEDSDERKVILALGDCLAKGGKTNEASQFYTEQMQINPDWPELRLQMASLAMGRKQGPQARKLIEQVLKMQPKNVDGWIANAKLFSQEGKPEQSQFALQKALALEPENPSLLRALSWVNSSGQGGTGADWIALQGVLEQASLAKLDSLALRWGKNNAALTQIQIRQVEQNLERANLARALEVAKSLSTHDPIHGLNFEALIYFAKKDSTAAKTTMVNWMAKMPNTEPEWLLSAEPWMKMKFPAKAMDILSEAKKRIPDSEQIPKKLAQSAFSLALQLRKAGKNTEATETYRQSLAWDASQHKAHLNLGILLEEKGDFAQAMHEFELSVQAKPDYANGYYHQANAYWLRKDSTTARATVQKALLYDNDHAEARVLAQRLGIQVAPKQKGKNKDSKKPAKKKKKLKKANTR